MVSPYDFTGLGWPPSLDFSPLAPGDSVAGLRVAGFDFSHTLRAASKFSHTCLPNGSPPISPSSGRTPESSSVLSVCVSFPFAVLFSEVVCLCGWARGIILTTEQSAYSAPGFRTSTVNSSVPLPSRAWLLNGVGKNSPWRTVWIPEVGDFVKSHNNGWRRKYLNQVLARSRQQKTKYKQDGASESETRGVFPVGSEKWGNCVCSCDSWGNRNCDYVGPLELTARNVRSFAVHLRGLGALGHRV